VSALFETLRPRQWVKNLFVVAPLVFSRHLGDRTATIRGGLAFVVFCLLASAVYAINDVLDVERDRLHPVKRDRPVASGRLALRTASAAAVALIAMSLYAAARLGATFAAVASAYLLLNLVYSTWGKEVAFVDVTSIAAGFVLRVLGGAAAIHVRPSWYLLACTFLLALFLALGKRRHELAASGATGARAVLAHYDPRTLQAALVVVGALTAVAYGAYTLDTHTRGFFGTRWLPATAPFALFGIGRFLQLVGRRNSAASPTDEMLRDGVFLTNLALWGATILAIIYLR
jgi:4-hydroxybenzoate polyprenyltransferase